MIYDLSPTISERLQVWPGDTPPSREILLEIARGDNLTLSTLHATVHLGSHVDGPNHYEARALGVESWPLELFLGPAEVVHASVNAGERIGVGHFEPNRFEKGSATCPRLLIKSGTYPDPEHFNADFASIDPELIDVLAASGVRLMGIDTPSVDAFDSKDLPAHHRCAAHGIAILEGLRLGEVPDGTGYELIALPLKLEGFDASPVRAILRKP